MSWQEYFAGLDIGMLMLAGASGVAFFAPLLVLRLATRWGVDVLQILKDFWR